MIGLVLLQLEKIDDGVGEGQSQGSHSNANDGTHA